MLYAIYAYEGMYGGLHGMDNHAIVDCRDEGEAEDIGVEMSYDVMGSYECISSSFQEEASGSSRKVVTSGISSLKMQRQKMWLMLFMKLLIPKVSL